MEPLQPAKIIRKIEKRVWELSEEEKTEIKALVEKYEDGYFTDFEYLAHDIATMLRTNENVIYDILTEDLDLNR